MSAQVSIGDVLDQLRPEFDDITISKIRFLESQGLIDPERTASGYRKFSPADVERLRFILRQQREHFLPLKVIKERLDQLDRGVPAETFDAPPEAVAEAGADARNRAGASRPLRSPSSRWLAASPRKTKPVRSLRRCSTPKVPTITGCRRPP